MMTTTERASGPRTAVLVATVTYLGGCGVLGTGRAAEAARALAQARQLIEQALHLRQHGERPPGAPADPHAETWGDWDRRADAWARRQP